uniref:Uncharacterized protein n=1 Tax=Nelumbo nucifera TaxID=4432 RepID=A0A822YZ65_NELNU|nr:TPA_asm: hypothetical protein HUJ06_006676 [Nelumbo nucifera]
MGLRVPIQLAYLSSSSKLFHLFSGSPLSFNSNSSFPSTIFTQSLSNHLQS